MVIIMHRSYIKPSYIYLFLPILYTKIIQVCDLSLFPYLSYMFFLSLKLLSVLFIFSYSTNKKIPTSSIFCLAGDHMID